MFGVCLRLFCVYVVLCLGSDLATGRSLVQEFYRLCKMITELNKRPGPMNGLSYIVSSLEAFPADICYEFFVSSMPTATCPANLILLHIIVTLQFAVEYIL
jgi:hypothetical protein